MEIEGKFCIDEGMEKIAHCFLVHRGVKKVIIFPEGVAFDCDYCGRSFVISQGVWDFLKESCIPAELMPKEKKFRPKKVKK